MNETALLIIGFQKFTESFLAAGFTGGREYHREKRVGCSELYGPTPGLRAKAWYGFG
jgi:hypothetical protein